MAKIVFQETQRFRQIWIWAILLGVTGISLGSIFFMERDAPLDFSDITFPTGMLLLLNLLFLSFTLSTRIVVDRISYRFFPFTRWRSYRFEAIDSMNCLFRDRFPSLRRDAVDPTDLPALLKLPSVVGRDVSKPRKIPIFFLVDGTRNKSFDEQRTILDIQGMVPADPIEQLMTAMAYSFLYPGNDPFKNQLARGSFPNFALFNTTSHGLRTMALSGGRCPIASMSALPAIIN